MSTLVMLSTAGSEKEANRLAKTLVQEKLAACANVIPRVTSYFYWEGKLCREKEVLVLAKTVREKSKKIIDKVKKIHSYGVPEIIFLKVEGGEKSYLQWVRKMVGENIKSSGISKNFGRKSF